MFDTLQDYSAKGVLALGWVATLLSLLTCASSFAFADMESSEALDPQVVEFFGANCCYCHDQSEKSGGLDLTSLPFNPADAVSMKIWSMVIDRVAKGEMPPKDEATLDAEELTSFVTSFEKFLHDASANQQREFGRVRARRLNRIEFENTLQHLLGIDIPISEVLPEDAVQDGFSNIAEAQQISHHLLEKYLEGIDIALDEAFFRAQNPIPQFSRVLSPKEISQNRRTRKNERGPHLYQDHALSFLTSGSYQGRLDPTTVEESGWYRITIRAKAHHAPRGRGVWTQVRTGVVSGKAPTLYWAGHFEATNDPQNFTMETWIRAGHKLEVRPGDRTLRVVSVKRLESDPSVFESDIPAVAMESIKLERIQKGMKQRALQRRLIDHLPLENGTLKSNAPSEDLRRLMVRFARLAFRRTIDESELSPYLDFAQSQLDSGVSLLDSLKSGYRSLLASPQFLYFSEQTGKLDDFSIASRLSYFLWSSMPDTKLLALAEQGKLSKSAVLRRQVNRMLDDPKATAFVESFSDTWLNLKEIDFTTPDSKLYPEFDHILKHSMLGETHAFLSELIRHDLSVTNIIDSDFVMLNERLAEHYGIKGASLSGRGFQKVSLKPNDHRGGLLTQGSILKVTANGTTTSPVIRGVWLLRRIIGQQISPPPDDVPAVEPDIRGATTIRDELEKHRSTEACMACHKTIDPPGFALENFDVIGGWRENYRILAKRDRWTDGPAVESGYHLPSGETFEGIEGFKALVLERPDRIARNLVNQVLTYATGASIEFADRREINQIVEQLAESDYGFRSLIHASVQSSIFQTK